MQDVKVFKAERSMDSWGAVINELHKKGIMVRVRPEPCDVAIVFSGRYENPLCFSKCKKRICLYHANEWMNYPCGFDFIESILEEYYTEIIDITTTDLPDIVDIICSIVKGE